MTALETVKLVTFVNVQKTAFWEGVVAYLRPYLRKVVQPAAEILHT